MKIFSAGSVKNQRKILPELTRCLSDFSKAEKEKSEKAGKDNGKKLMSAVAFPSGFVYYLCA